VATTPTPPPARKAAKKAVKKVAKKAAKKAARKATPAKPPKSELYEVRRSRIQGRGAFAIKPIRKGQIVDEYWGQRITHEEADRRYDDNEGRHHTFLFVLDENTVLDARYGGNDARFINHSCDPNCETLAGNDVKKPKKPVRKRTATQPADPHVRHPHVAERHATRQRR